MLGPYDRSYSSVEEGGEGDSVKGADEARPIGDSESEERSSERQRRLYTRSDRPESRRKSNTLAMKGKSGSWLGRSGAVRHTGRP